MSRASLGRFPSRPCFRSITRHLPGLALFFLAGLLWFGVPVRAERADALEPGTGELRYELPGFSPEPPAPDPDEDESEKTVEPEEEFIPQPQPPPRSTQVSPPPATYTRPTPPTPPTSGRGLTPVFTPSPRLESDPAPIATPAPVSAPEPAVEPAFATPPAPKAVAAPKPISAPLPVVAPTPQPVAKPAPAPTPAPAPAPAPAPVRAQNEFKPQGQTKPQEAVGARVQPRESAKAAEPQEISSPKAFRDAPPLWARKPMASHPPATAPRQSPAPVPLAEETAQVEPALQEAAPVALPQKYVGDETTDGENTGYGSVDASLPRRGTGQAQSEAPMGAMPPPVLTHERAPEEKGQLPEVPRDERVPENIGPYAWVPGSEAPPPEPGTEDLPWDLSADKVTAYNQNSVVDAEGEVFLKRGQEYLKADFARYFADTGWVYLKGNVEIYFGSDRLSGKEAEFDLANKVGWVKEGQVFMAGPHVYLSGEKVNKNWGDTYTFHNAKVTTCDGDVPAWSLYAEDAVVELDGYARLWGSSLAIKNQKIAYSPYMVIPAKRDRQSGFLVPRAGQDSRKGFYWDQSYFWAIDESRDMTFNTYIMSDRGVMMGAEYRSKQEWDENLWVRADYLNDSETWDNSSDNYFSNGYLRTNADRFWLRGMYDGTPFSDRNWKVKGNLDYVSDAFFLREFKNDSQGFNTTRDYLENSFGRTLAPWSSNRVSEGVVYRDWDRITVSAGMRYEQNPYLGNGNQPRSSDIIAQKLPDINMYLHKGQVWEGWPVEAEGEGQMVYFYRRDGVKGMRYDLNPKLSLPLRNDYGSLIPQFAVRGSLYQAGNEGRIQGDTGSNDDNSRAVPEFSLAGFTEFARNYDLGSVPLAVSEENVGNRRWSGLRHTIQPRVDYIKRWKVDQDDLPYFDTIDRLAPRDEVIYSLTNLFTVKRESVGLDKDKNPVAREDYIDFVRFKLETGYDFDEARRTWKREAYKRRPFMDILADVTIMPGNWFSITSRTWWSPYNGEFTRMDNDITLWEQGIGRLQLGLDSRRKPDEYKRWSSEVLYRDLSLLHRGLISEDDLIVNKYREPVDLLYADVKLDYFAPFSFSFQQWYDLRSNEAQETHLSVIYTHQCFQLETYMWWDQHDENYGFSVRLPGFWN